MDIIIDWIKSGLLFGIFASVIMMLSPNKTYLKHISFIIGLLFVLVMLHPVMELLDIDGSTYLSYIQNYFAIEEENEISPNDLAMYEESLSLELTLMLQREEFAIEEAKVHVDENGNVETIEIIFSGNFENIEKLNLLLVNIFGEETEIEYKMG